MNLGSLDHSFVTARMPISSRGATMEHYLALRELKLELIFSFELVRRGI